MLNKLEPHFDAKYEYSKTSTFLAAGETRFFWIVSQPKDDEGDR